MYSILFRPKRGILDFLAPVSVARFRIIDFHEMLKDPDIDLVHINSPILSFALLALGLLSISTNDGLMGFLLIDLKNLISFP